MPSFVLNLQGFLLRHERIYRGPRAWTLPSAKARMPLTVSKSDTLCTKR